MRSVGITHRLGVTLRIALLDFGHDWIMSACSILSVVVITAPLLVLFNLKTGFVEGMLSSLRTEPSTLELRPVGQGSFGTDWFSLLDEQPGVAFWAPNTRFLAAAVLVSKDQRRRGATVEAELVPTAPGDPVMADSGSPPNPGQDVALSWTLAERLAAQENDTVRITVGRMSGGIQEQAVLRLMVHSIIERRHFNREALYVDVETLRSIEAYREGAIEQPDPQLLAANEIDDDFSGFRLYAESLEDVLTLETWLLGQGIEVYTRAADIRRAFLLDCLLSILFGLLLLLGAIGAGATLGVTSFAAVLRKQRQLSILRLIGISSKQVAAIPMIQALATAMLGYAMAIGVLFGLRPVLRQVLEQGEEVIGRTGQAVLPGVILTGASITVGVAIVSAYFSGLRASLIEPSQGLRDD